jgi:hypothetical protein
MAARSEETRSDRNRLLWAVVFYLLALAAQVSGFTNSGVALFLAGIATIIAAVPAWHHTNNWFVKRGYIMGTPQIILLLGIGGVWLAGTVALGATAWLLLHPQPVVMAVTPTTNVPVQTDPGPLVWFTNLTMEGGPLSGTNVFSLRFKGTNASQNEVRLKNASIISAITGAEIPLEVGLNKEIVPVSAIELIPPGAPIDLIAKFGPPDPNNPTKIMGIPVNTFIETWSRFSFNAEDDTRKYRVPYNEGSVAVFFPNMVGPHVSKKSTLNAQ